MSDGVRDQLTLQETVKYVWFVLARFMQTELYGVVDEELKNLMLFETSVTVCGGVCSLAGVRAGDDR